MKKKIFLAFMIFFLCLNINVLAITSSGDYVSDNTNSIDTSAKTYIDTLGNELKSKANTNLIMVLFNSDKEIGNYNEASNADILLLISKESGTYKIIKKTNSFENISDNTFNLSMQGAVKDIGRGQITLGSVEAYSNIANIIGENKNIKLQSLNRSYIINSEESGKMRNTVLYIFLGIFAVIFVLDMVFRGGKLFFGVFRMLFWSERLGKRMKR